MAAKGIPKPAYTRVIRFKRMHVRYSRRVKQTFSRGLMSAFRPLQTLAELTGLQVKRQLASVSSPMEI
jgi:hypothetical protein